MNQAEHKGKVVLAGAGPGDPELISVKAARYLQQADVVLTDRLVSPAILTEYVSPQTELIYVGKQCRRGASTPQETINELMIEHALEGKLVVRLKGGDVSVFSNILDELQVLVENGIPYEIVPGISAALGAAAYSGIPLTARGYSTAIRFLTYYKSDVVTDAYWKELAASDDTLVFYMSSETLEGVVANLTRQGISAEKSLAVIEQATTPMQQVHMCSLYEFETKLKGKSYISPSLVIIGKTVSLHRQFSWFEGKPNGEAYFKPLSGSLKQLVNLNKETAYAGRA